jgi:hypothetical protein
MHMLRPSPKSRAAISTLPQGEGGAKVARLKLFPDLGMAVSLTPAHTAIGSSPQTVTNSPEMLDFPLLTLRISPPI